MEPFLNLQGMFFLLTQAKYQMPMTEPEEELSDSGTSPAENDSLNRFDKAEIRAIILGAGGRILQEAVHPAIHAALILGAVYQLGQLNSQGAGVETTAFV
jgi:hypothetical protein